jgi:hypothetical protein
VIWPWLILGFLWGVLLVLNHRLVRLTRDMAKWKQCEDAFRAEFLRVHMEIAHELETSGHAQLAARLRRVVLGIPKDGVSN